MARKTPISPACDNNINAKKLPGFLYWVLQVAIKIIGNEIAVSSVNIFPIPSTSTVKRLLKAGSHSASKRRCASPLCMVTPTKVTIIVSTEENNDQLLEALSFFIKNPSSPLSKGININKTGIIKFYQCGNVRNVEMW